MVNLPKVHELLLSTKEYRVSAKASEFAKSAFLWEEKKRKLRFFTVSGQ